MEDWTPLFLRLEVNEVLRVEESGCVGAVIGTPDLIDNLRDFRVAGQDDARLVGDREALFGTRGRSQRAAHPHGAFIQVR